MSRVFALLSYKVKMFFGPSYRGRFGPLPLIGLALLFVPSGLGVGYGVGYYMASIGVTDAVVTLSALFSAVLAFGFIFSLGVGITAHSSELDFLMTAPVRSREYLISDMLFQFTSITLAGGMAILAAVFGLLLGLGKSLLLAFPLLLVAGVFAFFVFMIIQIVTVLKIRHPKARVRTIAIVLLVLSILPAIPALTAAIPVGFIELPIPQSAFASLASSILFGGAVDLYWVVVALAYFGVIFAVWFSVSSAYFFYGVRPTMSAGFGQIDMGVKMAQQRRLIGVFGGATSTIGLHTEAGGDLSLMTRLGLIRIWRDGSIFFVGLLMAIFLFSGVSSSTSGDSSGLSVNIIQATGWPIAVIALNWCYYERENLWIPVVGGRSLMTYFRGFALSLMILGLGISMILLGVFAAVGISLSMPQIANAFLTPIADSAIAVMLLTRIKVKPGAFSAGLLVVLFVTFICGAVIAFGGSAIIGALDVGAAALLIQIAATAVMTLAVVYVSLIAIDRLARDFRF